jgi:two-component system cell cycle sensor histidine kinase/response regulator CckA
MKSAAQQQHDPARGRVEDRGGTETILLLEDDDTTRTLTRMILEDLGYRVLSAETGTHAAQLNRSFDGDIHLLLSDIMIPDGNGVDWARRLRMDRPHMSTVFMSAYTREALMSEGIPDPGLPFLRKPFPAAVLAWTLREALDT